MHFLFLQANVILQEDSQHKICVGPVRLGWVKPWLDRTLIQFGGLSLPSLSLRSAVGKPDAACFSALGYRDQKYERHKAWRPLRSVSNG